MIPKECKRLAEVDLPIAEVSRHAVREKSIRHGHLSTLRLWWAHHRTEKRGVVRLLPVAERAKDLFGEDGASAAAGWIESDPGGTQEKWLLDAMLLIMSG